MDRHTDLTILSIANLEHMYFQSFGILRDMIGKELERRDTITSYIHKTMRETVPIKETQK